MPKMKCPRCGAKFGASDDEEVLRCPECHRIDRDQNDEMEVHEDRRPGKKKRRKNPLKPKRTRGLFAAIIIVPMGLAIAIAAHLLVHRHPASHLLRLRHLDSRIGLRQKSVRRPVR